MHFSRTDNFKNVEGRNLLVFVSVNIRLKVMSGGTVSRKRLNVECPNVCVVPKIQIFAPLGFLVSL